MTRVKRIVRSMPAVLAAALYCGLALPAAAQDTAVPHTVTPDHALQMLASLEGKWEGLNLGGEPIEAVYQVIGGGTMIIEILGPGHQKEMATVFAMQANELVATHFCASGNRTEMRFDPAASTPSRLVFRYVSLTGVDIKLEPEVIYVHSMGISQPPDTTGKDRMVHTQVHYQGRTELGAYSTEMRRIQ